MKYDYMIVGSGLYGATFAQLAHESGKSVLVVDKRDHVAGNAWTEDVGGIEVHRMGAHIFHTNDEEVWQYVNRFAVFNRFTNSPIANYKGELYSLPFNMYTFNKMWNVTLPEEAKRIISHQQGEIDGEPKNLEEQAIRLVGRDVYEKLVKGYTEKQWGCACDELPPSIIKRLPVRFTFDNNYFDALHQGIPVDGYTAMVERMLDGVEVWLNTDYNKRDDLYDLADKIIYTGPIDEFYDYCYGRLGWRTVQFQTEMLDESNYQGNAVVNYTDRETPWTRIIEHKWFTFGKDKNGNEIPHTVVSMEYSTQWEEGREPCYPINDKENTELYEKYKELSEEEDKVKFGGRLGTYKYLDMDKVIRQAMDDFRGWC